MKTLFLLDVDTQMDFMSPSGALYVAGAERLVAKLRRLFDFARKSALTVVSAVHAHSAGDAEFKSFPAHCLQGTDGQRKLDETLMPRPLILENRPLDLNLVVAVRKHQQIIIQRQGWDLFSNPVADRLLKALPARAIIFGVPAEHSVKLAAFGLQSRGVKAALLSDLVLSLDSVEGALALQEMRRAGIESLNLDTLLGIYSG